MGEGGSTPAVTSRTTCGTHHSVTGPAPRSRTAQARDPTGHSTRVPKFLLLTLQIQDFPKNRLHCPKQMASTRVPPPSTVGAPESSCAGEEIKMGPLDLPPASVPFSRPGSDVILQPRQPG